MYVVNGFGGRKSLASFKKCHELLALAYMSLSHSLAITVIHTLYFMQLLNRFIRSKLFFLEMNTFRIVHNYIVCLMSGIDIL